MHASIIGDNYTLISIKRHICSRADTLCWRNSHSKLLSKLPSTKPFENCVHNQFSFMNFSRQIKSFQVWVVFFLLLAPFSIHHFQLRCKLYVSKFDSVFVFLVLVCFCMMCMLKGHHKCREQWPENAEDYERAFNLFLDVILLIFPLIMLSSAYFSITKTLWQGMALEQTSKRYAKSSGNNNYQHACK